MRDLILNSKCLVSFLDENVIEATLSLNLISISKENKLEGRSDVLLGPDNDIKFLKHLLNVILKN